MRKSRAFCAPESPWGKLSYMDLPIKIDEEAIARFCKKWRISALELFGSILREDFGPDSDVDILVSFEPGAVVTMGSFMRVERELAEIIGRKVDLVDRGAVEESRNRFRKRSILESARPFYHAA